LVDDFKFNGLNDHYIGGSDFSFLNEELDGITDLYPLETHCHRISHP
jgi:hypothetical protein